MDTYIHENGGVSSSYWKVVYKNGRFSICRDTVVIERRVFSTAMSVVIMIVTTVIDIYTYIGLYIYIHTYIYT